MLPLARGTCAYATIERPSTKVTYLLSILSAEEASKVAAKCEPISSSLVLSDTAPWDMMKAKLLVEIDTALSPHFLDFDDYILMYFIPRILLKPGIALSTEEHYNALLVRAANLTSKTPTINLTIQEKKKKKSNKENAPATAEAQAIVETKGKKVNMQPQVIVHISDQYSRRKIPPSSQEISSERKTSRSFRTVGSVFLGNLDVLVHIATFSLTQVFTIHSTMKGWSAGHLRWYFLNVPPHLFVFPDYPL